MWSQEWSVKDYHNGNWQLHGKLPFIKQFLTCNLRVIPISNKGKSLFAIGPNQHKYSRNEKNNKYK